MGFVLKIIVPEQLVFEGEVSSVTLPTLMGEIQILENHLPIIGGLEAGTVHYTAHGEPHSMAIDVGSLNLRTTNSPCLLRPPSTSRQSTPVPLTRPSPAPKPPSRKPATPKSTPKKSNASTKCSASNSLNNSLNAPNVRNEKRGGRGKRRIKFERTF